MATTKSRPPPRTPKSLWKSCAPGTRSPPRSSRLYVRAWSTRNPGDPLRPIPDPRFDTNFARTVFTKECPLNAKGMVFNRSLFRVLPIPDGAELHPCQLLSQRQFYLRRVLGRSTFRFHDVPVERLVLKCQVSDGGSVRRYPVCQHTNIRGLPGSGVRPADRPGSPIRRCRA